LLKTNKNVTFIKTALLIFEQPSYNHV